MATNDLGIRFTEENYATKSEVIKTLNTSLVDSIWSNILLYRHQFNHYTKLHDVSKSLFFICLCNSVKDKARDLDDKVKRLNDRYSGLKPNSIDKYQIDKPNLTKILREVAHELNIFVNDVALDNIISHRPVGEEYSPIINYLNALDYIEKFHMDALDDNLVAKLYSILNGGGELNSFYRTSEFVSYQSKALINREYEGIPSRLIEDSMNNLFDFLADEEVAFTLRLPIAYYMVNFIKPFDKYNELIATLMIKYLLLRRGISGSTYVPFEHIYTQEEKLKVCFKETQKSRDLTYVITRVIPLMSSYIGEPLDELVRMNMQQIRDEFYGKDHIEEEANEPISLFSEEELKEEPAPEVFKEAVEKEPLKEEPVYEELAPVEEEIHEEPVHEEIKPAIAPSIKKERKPYEHKMVKREKDYTPVSRNEAELIEMEEDMLESDPSLKAHMAHFYVRHCTVGKFYTIQQYKRLEGCVYETARTSMDNLAKKGYYKREQVKNKFVYTPIKKD